MVGNLKTRNTENRYLTNPGIYLVCNRQLIFLLIILLNTVFNSIHFVLREDITHEVLKNELHFLKGTRK